ncbi:MAG: hypothetical protein ACXWL8_02250 [Candidatus Limnocylindria bacterium]
MSMQPASAPVLPDEPLEPAPSEDEAPLARFPWLTPRHLMFFVIGWLVLFSLGSVLISNPFQAEPSASVAPDYWRVMYLHGMLIGMVGLLALLTCSVLQLRSRHTRLWIVGGVLFATMLTAIGGIWDRQIPGAEIPMWTQIAGFFALDEILIVLLVGMLGEWRRGTPISRGLPFWAAFLGAGSMLVAALMGHLAGWIMEFGAFPTVIGDYARGIGMSVTDWSGSLVGSHSHEMALAVMVLTLAIASQQFGFGLLHGVARLIGRFALGVVALGTVAMTVMYVVMGFTAWAPPALFTSADGVNGIAADDVVTGVLVLGAGLLAMLAFALAAGDRRTALFAHPTRLATIWAWVLSFATVVVAGFAIELNTAHFGAGDPAAPGAANDAVFTWFHQDIALFLLPAMMLVMLVVERLVAARHRGPIALMVLVGTSVTFVCGLVFVFIDPALHGPGYLLTSIGLLIVGVALLATIWWGALHTMVGRRPVAAPPQPAHGAV